MTDTSALRRLPRVTATVICMLYNCIHADHARNLWGVRGTFGLRRDFSCESESGMDVWSPRQYVELFGLEDLSSGSLSLGVGRNIPTRNRVNDTTAGGMQVDDEVDDSYGARLSLEGLDEADREDGDYEDGDGVEEEGEEADKQSTPSPHTPTNRPEPLFGVDGNLEAKSPPQSNCDWPQLVAVVPPTALPAGPPTAPPIALPTATSSCTQLGKGHQGRRGQQLEMENGRPTDQSSTRRSIKFDTAVTQPSERSEEPVWHAVPTNWLARAMKEVALADEADTEARPSLVL